MQKILDKMEDLEKKVDTLTLKSEEEREEEATERLFKDVDACRDLWRDDGNNAPGI